MKCTGKEFKAFFNDAVFWHPGDDENERTYMDDVIVSINGDEFDDWLESDISDNCKVEIISGVVLHCAKGSEEQSLNAYFKRWKKEQTSMTFIVECDKSKYDAVVAAIKAAGGKVAK